MAPTGVLLSHLPWTLRQNLAEEEACSIFDIPKKNEKWKGVGELG